MRTSNELQVGKAGEYIVCADLIMKGFVAFPSEQGLPYDVLLDIGHRIFRVQVKTTSCPRVIPQRSKETRAYIFNIKRAGKNNAKRYSNSEIDLFALVCLDTRKVGYLTSEDMPDTINIRADALRGTYYDEQGAINYQKALLLKESHGYAQIARELNMHVSQVYRMLQKGYVPHETGARYFSHFEREREWFLGL